MRLSVVVAVSENGVIGRGGDIPWRLPDDQKFFKELTIGHTLVMGRATFQSIGRVLPGRTTIVVSRDDAYAAEGALLAHSLDEALELAEKSGASEVFVVGGAAIYEAALPRAHRLFVTRVHAVIEGDTRFPDFEDGRYGAFERCEVEHHGSDARHAIAFSIERWQRRPAVTPTH